MPSRQHRCASDSHRKGTTIIGEQVRFLDIEALYTKQITGFTLLSVAKLSVDYIVSFNGSECKMESSGSGSGPGSGSKCVLGKRLHDGLYQLHGHAVEPNISLIPETVTSSAYETTTAMPVVRTAQGIDDGGGF